MLKSIHLVGASLEVGEHHYHYVSSGLCCSSIMFSKQLSCVLSNPQNHHFTFFVTLQIHLHLPFVLFFYVRCFSRLMHKKFFPFVFKLLKIQLQFFLVLVFPRSRLLALLPGLISPVRHCSGSIGSSSCLFNILWMSPCTVSQVSLEYQDFDFDLRTWYI